MGNPVKLSDLASDATVQVLYQNDVGLTPDQINALFSRVQQLYGPIEINHQPWPTGGAALPSSPYYTVIFASKPVQGYMREQGGEAIEGARRAYIYPSQLQNYGSEQQTAEGDILAHEIGHLLGLKHSGLNNVMSREFTPEIVGEGIRPLTKRQIKRVRTRLSDLAGDRK